MRFYKIPHEQLLVAHDDLDLPLGTLRLRPGGGSAGQKGMASIIQQLGTQNFARLRIGIGRPPGQMDAAAYVLQDFTRQEKEVLATVLDRAVKAALRLCRTRAGNGHEPVQRRFKEGNPLARFRSVRLKAYQDLLADLRAGVPLPGLALLAGRAPAGAARRCARTSSARCCC